MKKDVDDMDDSEIKKEMEKLYKKIADLEQSNVEDLSFDAKMKIEKKNEDGEVVEKREMPI